MTTKQRVLARLEEKRGEAVSGEVLARSLGVSRATVWKAVRDLKAEGHAIEAVTNRGYTLRADSQRLSAEGIAPLLRTGAPVYVYDEVASTNLTAKELAAAGAPHGTLVVSDCQTAGRGRRGRSFVSPHVTGLYLTMVVRSALPMGDAARITSAAAVAVCRALESECGKHLVIKWVNDVYRAGRKCVGILTEASADMETGGVDFIVVGIGLNLREPEGGFAPEIRDIAGAIFDEGEPVPRCAIAAAVANELFSLCGELSGPAFMEEYRARNIVPGRDVIVIQNGVQHPAHAESITDEGHLIVRLPSGETEELSFGEISIRGDFS